MPAGGVISPPLVKFGDLLMAQGNRPGWKWYESMLPKMPSGSKISLNYSKVGDVLMAGDLAETLNRTE
jgi:hypothetical protein